MSKLGIGHEFLYEVLLMVSQPDGAKVMSKIPGEDSASFQQRMQEFGDKARENTTQKEQDELKMLAAFCLVNISHLAQQELATAGVSVIAQQGSVAGEA